MLTNPGPMQAPLAAAVDDTFSETERIELGLGLGLFHGFSKMLIALGLEPDEMDTTVLPTPEALGLEVASVPVEDDPHLALLAARPDLAARWAAMVALLQDLPGLPRTAAEAARQRLAQLYGVAAPIPTMHLDASPATSAAIDCAERFALDVRSLGPEQLAAVREGTGFTSSVVELVMNLAIYDGFYRYWATSADGA